MKTFHVLSWILLALLNAVSVEHAVAAEVARPNIIFILADDLGWTDLSCAGSKFYQTPHIDRLAAQGMSFRNGYTAGPNCQPTRAALMSGQYGPRTGVYTVGGINRFNWQSRPLRPVDNAEGLALEKVTVAEALQKAGYRTGLFGKWHLGNNEKHPSHQGFDEAIVSMGQHFDFDTTPRVEVPKGQYLADFLTERALEFIQKHQREPFFLSLHHFAVHSPHVAKPELAAKFEGRPGEGGHKSPVYAAMLASLDESVGRIVAQLEELKLAENTLVIFTSDNGGVGGYEREGIRSGGITDNAPLRGGKGMLYEGGIRVPYLFRWPGRIRAGAANELPIHSVDLYPTLLELAGAKAEPNYPLDGASYARSLLGERSPADQREALYWHFPGYLGAGQNKWRTTPVSVIRSGDWKLLEFLEDKRIELYNLREDLSEKHDLAGSKPEKAAALRAQLAGWRKSIQAPMPTPNTGGPSGDDRSRKPRRNRL